MIFLIKISLAPRLSNFYHTQLTQAFCYLHKYQKRKITEAIFLLNPAEKLNCPGNEIQNANYCWCFDIHDQDKFHAHVRWVMTQGYKTFFMLNSIEHEISTAHKNLNTNK